MKASMYFGTSRTDPELLEADKLIELLQNAPMKEGGE